MSFTKLASCTVLTPEKLRAAAINSICCELETAWLRDDGASWVLWWSKLMLELAERHGGVVA